MPTSERNTEARRTDLSPPPSAPGLHVFTWQIGLTEQAARAKSLDGAWDAFTYAGNGKAIVLGEGKD